MPRVSKRSKRKTGGLPPGAVFHCMAGHDFFNNGFGDDLTAMRTAWESNPELRERAHAEARQRGKLRAAAWWMFQSPEPRNHERTEAEQLDKLGLFDDVNDLL
jgi:hypothetical protein